MRQLMTCVLVHDLPTRILVTGQEADEKTLDHLIETGESETIFQKAGPQKQPASHLIRWHFTQESGV